MQPSSIRCSNIFGHKFPAVKIEEGTVFQRVDCQRKHCGYSMDAAAFKRSLDHLPDGPVKRHLTRVGPKFES